MGIDLESMNRGLENLWYSLQQCVWPDQFFREGLGLSDGVAKNVPTILGIYFIVYMIGTVSALTLHVCQKQKSLSSWPDKLLHFVLTVLAIPGVRLLVQGFGAIGALVKSTPGQFSLTESGGAYLGSVMKNIWFPLFIVIVMIILMLIPIFRCIKYSKQYGASGIPWMLYDVGFGWACVSVVSMALNHSDPRWYLLLPVILLLNALGQLGDNHEQPQR
jgi:hypothetical protein